MATTYPCSRCSGSGTIQGFSHVVGGVCFKCHGSGRQKGKPSTSTPWVVLSRDRATGEPKHAYNVSAKSAEQAVAKALVTYSGASPAFKDEHDMSAPVAVPSQEWWTPERLEALYTEPRHSR